MDDADAAGPSDLMPVDDAVVEVDRTRHPSGIVPQLQNVVATVNLGVRLELKDIALQARNAEYNPKRFAAVIMRIRDPKTTALIFASGKMVCTGAKSEQESRLAARKYARIIQKLGFDATFKEFKIQNIVGSCDVKFPIRLEGLACGHSLFCNYEPELFPGLIYRMKSPKIVLLIFVSGKVVLTGAKQRSEIYDAFEMIYPILQEFRKGDARIPKSPTPSEGLMPPPKRVKADGSTPMLPPPASPYSAGFPQTPAGAPNLPPPTPAHISNIPPMTPAYGTGIPPFTPAHTSSIPPPTPAHASYLPPPTPAHASYLPPPTPAHAPNIPPPTPQHFTTSYNFDMSTPAGSAFTPAHHSNLPPPSPSR